MNKCTVETNQVGDKFWYTEGTKILHRIDGPAVVRANGHKEWWLDGGQMFESNYKYHTEWDEAVHEIDGWIW